MAFLVFLIPWESDRGQWCYEEGGMGTIPTPQGTHRQGSLWAPRGPPLRTHQQARQLDLRKNKRIKKERTRAEAKERAQRTREETAKRNVEKMSSPWEKMLCL